MIVTVLPAISWPADAIVLRQLFKAAENVSACRLHNKMIHTHTHKQTHTIALVLNE